MRQPQVRVAVSIPHHWRLAVDGLRWLLVVAAGLFYSALGQYRGRSRYALWYDSPSLATCCRWPPLVIGRGGGVVLLCAGAVSWSFMLRPVVGCADVVCIVDDVAHRYRRCGEVAVVVVGVDGMAWHC